MKVKVYEMIKFKSGDIIPKKRYDQLKKMYNTPLLSGLASSLLRFNVKQFRCCNIKRTFINKTNNKGE